MLLLVVTGDVDNGVVACEARGALFRETIVLVTTAGDVDNGAVVDLDDTIASEVCKGRRRGALFRETILLMIGDAVDNASVVVVVDPDTVTAAVLCADEESGT